MQQILSGSVPSVSGDEVRICPVCGDRAHLKIWCQVDGYDVIACGRCSAGYVSPLPSEKELKAYYDRGEWFTGGEKGGYQDYDIQTAWSVDMLRTLLNDFSDRQGLSILDIGCGYGLHLAAAAERGWKCFGVELSDHARGVARERLGDKACIVESVGELIPHEFDLILLLDVVEHLASPYTLFYQLFSIGAITPKTRIVITTPNAGSYQARNNSNNWPYLHPPSHLVYYTDKTLDYLLKRLHFREVSICGLHPYSGVETSDSLAMYDGLLVVASGSDFTEFMRERYVPGTWSKIAEYEHIPRYALTRSFAEGKNVLDFGCGTGYGSAILAEVAESVTGLDIDDNALIWARENHRNHRLSFVRSDNLGRELPPASFDLISCFEMIEHVNQVKQKEAVSQFAKLLKEDGLLFISTPNPDVTKLYGENPYHLHEMSEREFVALLQSEFPYISILRQKAFSSVVFERNCDKTKQILMSAPIKKIPENRGIPPLAYLAICSRHPLSEISNRIYLDEESDPIREYLDKENRLNRVRFAAYTAAERSVERIGALEHSLHALEHSLQEHLMKLSDWKFLVKQLLNLLMK